jgi:hypothetical protein
MSSSLKNETVTSLEPSFHPPFSFFSSSREIGDNLKVGEWIEAWRACLQPLMIILELSH